MAAVRWRRGRPLRAGRKLLGGRRADPVADADPTAGAAAAAAAAVPDPAPLPATAPPRRPARRRPRGRRSAAARRARSATGRSGTSRTRVSFYKPKPNPRVYAGLLRSAAGAINATDRRARVVLGGMAELAGVKGVTRRAATSNSSTASRESRRTSTASPRIRTGPSSAGFASRYAAAARDAARPRRVGEHVGDRDRLGLGGGRQPPQPRLAGQAASLSQAYSWFLPSAGSLHLKVVVWFTWQDSQSGTSASGAGAPGSSIPSSPRSRPGPR